MLGLNILISFGNSADAKEFVWKTDGWKECLKSLLFDRLAWIRLVGLPMSIWGKNNFAAIAGAFRRTIYPFENLTSRVDLLCVKIGILTSIRKPENVSMKKSCHH
ncbi:hypothetical protein LXL04_015963 [Taraxacum kok-saghyz]